MRLSLLLACLCIASWCTVASAHAQTKTGAETSGWYMYFGDHRFTENWGLHLEGQWRRAGIISRWEQLLIRPGINHDFRHGFTTLLAYTYLRDYPFENGGAPDLTRQPEHRILEELQYKHPIGPGGLKGVKLSHRFRLEQRFEGTAKAGHGVTAWEFAERARYRLTAGIPFRWNTRGALPDYTSVYDEVFVDFGPHAGSHALDQNRTYGALGWNLGPNFQLELGYLHQYLPVSNGVVGEHNNALQITINSTAPFRRGLRK